MNPIVPLKVTLFTKGEQYTFFNDNAESLVMEAPDRDRNRENDDCKCHPNEFE